MENNSCIFESDTFENLKKLKKLFLGKNCFNTIFNGLSSLEELYLNDNKITSMHTDTFKNLSNLKVLDLSNNHLDLNNLSNVFQGLVKLENLNLNNNGITIIKNGPFKDLHELKNLYLSSNQLNLLESSFDELANVCFLDLSWNKIAKVDVSFLEKFNHLKNLILSKLPLYFF